MVLNRSTPGLTRSGERDIGLELDVLFIGGDGNGNGGNTENASSNVLKQRNGVDLITPRGSNPTMSNFARTSSV